MHPRDSWRNPEPMGTPLGRVMWSEASPRAEKPPQGAADQAVLAGHSIRKVEPKPRAITWNALTWRNEFRLDSPQRHDARGATRPASLPTSPSATAWAWSRTCPWASPAPGSRPARQRRSARDDPKVTAAIWPDPRYSDCLTGEGTGHPRERSSQGVGPRETARWRC
jgi:hypothetical protein